MAKHFILKVTKVTYSPHAPWMVRVPPNLWEVEGQKKKFFATEAVAKAYKDRLSRSTVNYQLQAAALTDAQRLEAFECFAKLEPLAASLRAAVDHYVAYLAQAGKSLTVRDLVAEFLITKKQDDMSQRYLNDLKSKLGRFVGTFGETLVCDVSAQQLDGWLRGLEMSATSRDSYRRNLRVMFEAARRRGYCARNPAAEIRFTKRLKGEVTILAPRQVSRLLQVCASELVPYIAICAFAGLRPTEAASLDWSDIHLDTGEIEVKARHAKTRRHRLVPIPENLRAWLTVYGRESGRIYFSRRKFREAYRAAGFATWPLDVLRHSFGTYRLPVLKSAEALALEMGNSPDVIFRHYRRAMNATTGTAYFRILPADRLRPAFRIALNPDGGAIPQELLDRAHRNSPPALDVHSRKAA
jgi:integrase